VANAAFDVRGDYLPASKLVDLIEDRDAEIAELRASLKILWGILDQPPPEWKIIQDARNEVRKALGLVMKD
jgi:hypothetical protein